jgi:glyoxylase-like metal-dependent hydrolase (beta-lactamase superfamily II)/rhodanese-related sulfurtransferase
MTCVDVETLRAWLEHGSLVTVLDIRAEEDRQQWSIPGSVHINAYDDLKAGRASALEHVEFSHDQTVVTVCNFGRMAAVAAERLQHRGIRATPLLGGMKAWSLVWNTADVPVSNDVVVVQVRRTGKGCLSYLISSSGEAVVVDASLPPEVYLGLATSRGTIIRYVIDTHVHADHLSRSRPLAQMAGATLLLPAQDRVGFPFTAMSDGKELTFGSARLTAMRTPGHTMESTCYLLNSHALLTGDTLFLGSVGRPDLHASPEETRERAVLLYRSLRRIFKLQSELLVVPGHVSAPVAFDGKPIAAKLQEVESRLGPWLSSEHDFVDRVLSRIPPTPANYTEIVRLNEAGTLPEQDPTDLEAGANHCAV